MEAVLRDSELPLTTKDKFAKILQRQKDVKEDIFDEVIKPITEEELAEELSNASPQVAAGLDGRIRKAALDAMNRALVAGEMESTRVVITVIKKKTRLGNILTNLRPLNLQNTITKIMTGILARKLTKTLTKHKVLNNNQQGFVPQGQCQTLAATLQFTQ